MSPQPLTIVGGGLAGLSLGGALAQRGISVDLYEAEAYPRHKVCGEFITGLSSHARAALDLDPILATAHRHHTVRWFQGNRGLFNWTMPQTALGISRWTLDDSLSRALIAAGGRLHTKTRFRLPPRGDATATPEGLVQTTGRLPARGTINRPVFIGLKAHLLPSFELHADLEVHLGKDAYVGLSSVEHGRTNLCGLFRRRSLPDDANTPLLERYLAASGLAALLTRVKAGVIDESSRCAVAGLDFTRDTPATHWVRLGDSCGMIPPFTGHGMAIAFESAALALEPLSAYATGNLGWMETIARIQESHRRQLTRTMRCARHLHPMIYRPPLQGILSFAARAHVLPMNALYRLTHAPMVASI